MDGILNLELTPDWYHPDVRSRLADAVKKAKAIRASIAYWTVATDFVDDLLAERLSGPDGFLCVDYHLPTDIDQLARLAERGAAVYIHCADLPTPRREPPQLVHSKILFFWMADRTAEIWVGSHNWTRRALVGPNVESSAVIRVTETSALFCDALAYLDRTKQVCHAFDLSRVDDYKRLQNPDSEPGKKTIESEAAEAATLLGSAITVFGTEQDELREAAPLREICLSAFDESGNGEYIYRAQITASGLMPISGLLFAANRFAFRHGRRFPKLLPPSELTDDILGRAAYFIILQVQEEQFDLEALDPPIRPDPWQYAPASSSPLLSRMTEEQLRTVFPGRTPTLRIPADSEDTLATPAVLSERRELAHHRLIVRKLLRRRK
jgi:hypothetical protein